MVSSVTASCNISVLFLSFYLFSFLGQDNWINLTDLF